MHEFNPRVRFLNVLAVAVLLCGALGPLRAEMLIPRDTSNAYQKNPHARVRHILLQEGANLSARNALRQSLQRLAARYGFRLDTTLGRGTLTPAKLEGVDVVVFVSGFDGGADRLAGPDNSPTGATAAMERFIYQQGHGMLMINGAAAFITCPGTGANGGGDSLAHPDCRFMARAAARQYYGAAVNEGTGMALYVDSVRAGEIPPHGSLGAPDNKGPVPPPAEFSHGIANPETRNIFTGLPRVWPDIGDRWYRYTSSPRLVGNMTRKVATLDSTVYTEGAVNVLVSLDEMDASVVGKMGDHPLAWTRKMGNGLSAYSNPGSFDVYGRSDSIVEKFNWRLLRYLARDFVGCMNLGFAEYNPDASVTTLTASDDPSPCKTVVSLNPAASRAGWSMAVQSGVIHVRGVEPGTRVAVVDVAGKKMEARMIFARESIEIRGIKPGIYFVKITAPNGSQATRRVNLF